MKADIVIYDKHGQLAAIIEAKNIISYTVIVEK